MLYSFSGSAVILDLRRKRKAHLEYVQVLGAMSRIDIALDVADNTLFEFVISSKA